MKRSILFILLFAATITGALAQKKLAGQVIDAADQQPLAGATITAGSVVIVSDAEGRFSVDCNRSSSITISFIGFETLKYTIRNCDAPARIVLTRSTRALDEVEVTASSNPKNNTLYQPAAIGKLTPVELKRGTGLYLDDAILTNVPGVTMNRRSVSGGQQFNIRGYGNGSRGARGISSNFDGQGYKVYLNGIPVTDAEGITTLDDIDFGSVGDVEVTKGPAGTLYGLAIAGAVKLKTMKVEKGKTSIGQDVMLGNYGLQRYTTRFQMGKERSSLMLNYGHQKSNGYSIHNKSKKDFVNMIADFTPNDQQIINTYAGYSNSYDERLGELTVTQYENNDFSGNPEYIKRNAHSNVITFRAGASHAYRFNKNISNSTTIFGTGFTSNASSAGGWTDKDAINYGLRSIFDTRIALNGGASLNGVTGVELQRQDAQVIGYSMKQDPNDPSATWVYGTSPYWVINASTSNQATVNRTSSLFTEWTLSLPSDLSITAGVGVSNMRITLNDRFNPAIATRPAKFDTSYKGMVSPSIAINKVFNRNFSVYASYRKGYKAPVSSYFFITTPAVASPATPATGRVNSVLKPESGSQFEIGTKGQLLNNRLNYELTYFNAVFSNKMSAVSVVSPASPSTTLYSYVVNGGKQIDNGFEAMLKITAFESANGFLRSLRPFGNITYSDYTYGSNFTIQKSVVLTENYSDKAVAGVSKIVANLGLDAALAHGIYLNVTYNYRDKMPITSLNDLYATSFNLLNGKIGVQHPLGRHFNIDAYFGANNLTDTKHYIMVFVNQIPDAYIPAARTAVFFGGVNLKYTL